MASVYFAREAGLAATGVVTSMDPAVAMTLLQDCLTIQVTYGAVLMSFAGEYISSLTFRFNIVFVQLPCTGEWNSRLITGTKVTLVLCLVFYLFCMHGLLLHWIL